MGDQHAGRVTAADLARQQLQHDRGRIRVEIAGWLVGQHQRGRCTSARATATRCSSPPDSSRGMLASRPARPTSASRSAARRSRGSGATPSSTSGSATFCATVRCGRMWKAWNTNPSFERRVSVRAVSSRRCDVDTVDDDRTGVGSVEPGDQVEQRRLARSRFADDRDVLAAADRQVQVVEHHALAIALGQAVDLQHAIDSTGRVRGNCMGRPRSAATIPPLPSSKSRPR